MNDKQENLLTAFKNSLNYLANNNAIWVANPVFAASHAAFETNISYIEAERDKQMISIEGYASEKKEKKKYLAENLMFVVGRMQSYAATVGNTGLLDNLNYTYGNLLKTLDTLIAGIVNDIITTANNYIAELSDYGVLPTTLTNLTALYESFEAILSEPRIAISKRKIATDKLIELFNDINKILSLRLDKDIEMFKTTNPDFYSGYWNVREIVDNSGRKVQIRGAIKDLLTGGAIKDVTVNVLGLTTSVKTSKHGIFSIKGLEPMGYELEILKKTYKPKFLNNIKVEADKLTKINIGLEKENSLQTFQTGAVVSIASGATINQILSPGITGLNNLLKLTLNTGGPLKISSSKIPGVHNNLLALMMNAGEQVSVTMSEIGEEGSMNLVMTNYGTIAASVNVQPGILQLLR